MVSTCCGTYSAKQKSSARRASSPTRRAWRVCCLIRSRVVSDGNGLCGNVEVDESSFGGRRSVADRWRTRLRWPEWSGPAGRRAQGLCRGWLVRRGGGPGVPSSPRPHAVRRARDSTNRGRSGLRMAMSLRRFPRAIPGVAGFDPRHMTSSVRPHVRERTTQDEVSQFPGSICTVPMPKPS